MKIATPAKKMLRFFPLSSLRVSGMHLIVLPGPGWSYGHPQAMDSGQESECWAWSGLGHAPIPGPCGWGSASPELSGRRAEETQFPKENKKIKVIYRKEKLSMVILYVLLVHSGCIQLIAQIWVTHTCIWRLPPSLSRTWVNGNLAKHQSPHL